MKLGVIFSGPIDTDFWGLNFLGSETTEAIAEVISLLQKGDIDTVLAVGGKNIKVQLSDNFLSESESGAIAKSVLLYNPKALVFYSAKSVDTFGNVKFDLVPFVLQRRPEVVKLISSKQHLKRIKLIVEAQDLSPSPIFQYVESGYELLLGERLKEVLLFWLTRMDPKGEGLIWRILLGHRKRSRERKGE